MTIYKQEIGIGGQNATMLFNYLNDGEDGTNSLLAHVQIGYIRKCCSVAWKQLPLLTYHTGSAL